MFIVTNVLGVVVSIILLKVTISMAALDTVALSGAHPTLSAVVTPENTNQSYFVRVVF
jgi:hypothetical protein